MSADLSTDIMRAEQRLQALPTLYEKHATKLKWAGGAVACVAVAPFVLMGIGGLVGGLVFAALGFTATQLAPTFAKRISNAKLEMELKEAHRHLQALKAEARKNPIETLQAVYLENESKLQTTADKIHKFAAKVHSYGLKVQGLKKDFPDDAATFDQVFDDMSKLLLRRREKFQEAQQKLEKSAKEIVRASAIWEMTQETAELRGAAGDLEEDFVARVRKETALDAVQQSLAASMADLDQLMMEEIDLRPPSQQRLEQPAS